MKNSDNNQPFKLPVNVRKLPKKGQSVNYTAPAEVRCEIAGEFDLIDIETFVGECLLSPWKRDGVQVIGTIKANIVQPCAVTAEPIKAQICEEIDALFVPEGSKLTKPSLNSEGEWIISAEGKDPPEPFVGDFIDIGVVFLEFFALGIDPFVRSENVEFEPVKTDETFEELSGSPFAVLESLKKH